RADTCAAGFSGGFPEPTQVGAVRFRSRCNFAVHLRRQDLLRPAILRALRQLLAHLPADEVAEFEDAVERNDALPISGLLLSLDSVCFLRTSLGRPITPVSGSPTEFENQENEWHGLTSVPRPVLCR